MSAIVLVITACLAGGQCRDFRMPLDADVTLSMCVRQGQVGLAQWAGDHPAYAIRRYRCEPARGDGAA